MNPFLETYESFSNVELVEIVINKHDYQPLAVEAASMELEKRQLSLEDYNGVLDEWRDRRSKEMERNRSFDTTIQKFKRQALEKLKEVDPTDEEAPEKAVRYFCVGLTAISVYQVFELLSLPSAHQELATLWNRTNSIFIVSSIFLATGFVLSWKLWRAGWMMLNFWSLLQLSSVLVVYFLGLKERYVDYAWRHADIGWGNIPFFMSVFLFGGMLWFLNKKEVKQVFRIDRKTMQLSFAYSALLLIVYLFYALV